MRNLLRLLDMTEAYERANDASLMAASSAIATSISATPRSTEVTNPSLSVATAVLLEA
jgi:hypothetical protein